MHGYKALLTKTLILSCSQVKKYRYNVWSFVSSQGSWMHVCLHKKQTYLPIKAENEIKMPVTATTVLLLLLHFHLSRDNNEYLFHEIHDLALYFPFSRIRVNRAHVVMSFIRTQPLQISSGSQSLGEKEHRRKDCKCQQMCWNYCTQCSCHYFRRISQINISDLGLNPLKQTLVPYILYCGTLKLNSFPFLSNYHNLIWEYLDQSIIPSPKPSLLTTLQGVQPRPGLVHL